MTRPKILLCDEPTSALDAKMTDEIVSVLKRAHAKFNMTIVIVTHELDVIKAMCHRTAILEHGKLVDVLDIKESDYVPEAKSYHDRVLEVLTDD